jgi:uncharacterized membrane protein YqjE
MDLHMLGSLQKAIPILFRQLDAYVDLAERDFAVAKNVALKRLKALAVFVLTGSFTVLLALILIIALVWDTEYRIATIGAMVGIFALVAILSAVSLMRQRPAPFASLRHEWRSDRALLHRVMSRDDEQTESAYAKG